MNDRSWSELAELFQDWATLKAEQGAEVGAIRRRVEEAVLAGIVELSGLESPATFAYSEPETLAEIRDARPAGPRRFRCDLSEPELAQRCLGAWLGRAAGCVLGVPVEGWDRQTIREWAERLGDYPLTDYFRSVPKARDQYGFPVAAFLKGQISSVAADDDLAYTVIGLHALEEHGFGFTSEALGREWVDHLPVACTAEEVALSNLKRGIGPPASGQTDNPYREWIGAQIRADIWGYVAPGQPELAAGLAYRDAVLSHGRNGVYGEMFFAALLAAAYVEHDLPTLVEIGLSEVPARSRFAEAIRKTLAWCGQDAGWETTWERIMAEYGHYHRVHTINNAALTVAALLHGGGDFTRTIAIAVMSGLDTDCNGATAGSVMGLLLGADGIPSRWTAPFQDVLHTYVRGFERLCLTDLAQRTARLATARPSRS